MINLYIDFDGVIKDTIRVSYKMMADLGIDLNNAFQNINKIYEEKIFRPAILTTVNSLGEMIAKTNYIRSKNEDISIICVPCGVEKSKIVKASKAILVDDYSGNLANWVKSGGIGIKFGYDKDYVSIDSLASFVSGEVVKKLALVC